MSKANAQFETLLQDLDRVKRRQKICKKAVQEDINSIINVLQNSVNEINNDSRIEEESDNQIRDKIQMLSAESLKMKPLDHVTKSHKEYFAYLSKLGKDVDKAFNKDIDNIFRRSSLDNDAINNVIREHYLREGKFNIQDAFKKELNLTGDVDVEKNFQIIHKIIEELDKKNIEPALQWALANEKSLEQVDSDLLFLLYQQKFIQEATSKGKEGAVKFARDNFSRFFPKYAPEIQRLMTGSLLYNKQ